MNKDLLQLVRSKKAILFDLFHTLTAVESSWSNGPITHEMLGISKEDWHNQLLECSRERLVGMVREPVKIVRDMAHAIDPSISEELIVQVTKNRIRRFSAAVTNIPSNTIAVVSSLRRQGKKLALVSNADVMEMQNWDCSPLADCFHATLFSCEVGFAKPEKEIFQLAISRLGVGSDECIFVGDGGSNELVGAKQCGISTVMIGGIIKEIWPDKIDERRKHADFYIENLEELISA